MDKKHKSQVFNLRDTVVQGDIQFAKGTKGEVHLFGNAECFGAVVNGTVYYHTPPVILDESSVKQHVLKNASAPPFGI